ncbi:MAG: PEP/pyruvate-binding domain-containing protein [Myxococcaceae bacterium]
MKYIIFFISINLSAAKFSPEALENKAELEGYGYKSANLLLLQKLFEHENKIKVPEFLGIPSSVIQQVLLTSGLDLPKDWEQIRQTSGQAFLDSNLSLAQQIKARFSELSNAHIPALDAFLSKAKQNHWRLMVRSTGKEDTDKLANAGGNLSVGNVSPDSKTVLTAIGQVIGSYFEERSLMQRLSAGDQTLSDLPLTPVLIQRMIGEELNGATNPKHIPVGCVLYTEETAARLAGIHTLQCAYGHNEGVVESLVPLDTYYVQQSGEIQSVLKRKTKRIVPMLENGVFGLEEKNNPESIQTLPALDKKAILQVARAGNLIDAYYQKRMDIELVYEPSHQLVYIVQARPLVIPDSKNKPSYLMALDSFSEQEIIRLTSINPVDSAVTRILNSKQIILGQSLEAALKIYTDPSFDRPSVRAIIVADQADSTSHASAVFRGDSKLIFVTDQLETLRTWLQADPVNLLIDTQRGLLLKLTTQEWGLKDYRDLFEQRILRAGWLNYPLPLRVSVGAHQPQYCLAPQMRPETFFGEITCLANRLENHVRELDELTQRTRARAHCDWNEPGCLEQKALATKVLPKLENLNTHAHELIDQIKHNPNQDLPELLSLFPKRFLESLVSQPAINNLADAYSVESVKAEYAGGQRFIADTLTPLMTTQILSENILRDPELFRIAELGSEASLTEKTTQRFLQFVDQTQDKPKLIELIDNLKALQILPMWLNGLFMEAAEKTFKWPLLQPSYDFLSIGSEKLLTHLDTEYQNSKTYLSMLQDKKAQMNSYDLSKWSNEKTFTKTRADFQNKFENYFSSQDFLGFSNKLQTIAAVSTMEQYVELFDQSIKTLKSRTDATRIEQFKIRIEDYFDLLKVWAPRAPQELIKFSYNWNLERYLNQVESLLSAKKDLTDTELLPSQMFSVAAGALGAATDFNRHLPQNLEDFFTLVHQSINTCMGAWNGQALDNLILPDDFENAWKSLNTSDRYPLYLTGIRVENGEITYSINLPLQSHSGKLKLSYYKASHGVDLTFQFLSEARNRWDLIRDYVLLKSEEHEIIMSNVIQNFADIEFTLESINKPSDFQVGVLKDEIAELTFTNTEERQKAIIDKLFQKYSIEELQSWALKHNGLGLATRLINSPESMENFGLPIAIKGSQSLNPFTQTIAIVIFTDLAKNNIGIHEALEAFERLCSSSNSSIQYALLTLIFSLSDSGGSGENKTLLHEAIARAAEQNITSSEPIKIMAALFYYITLSEQEKYRPIALEAAEKSKFNKDPLVIGANLSLFSELIPYNLGIKSGFELAKAHENDPTPLIKMMAERVLHKIEALNK